MAVSRSYSYQDDFDSISEAQTQTVPDPSTTIAAKKRAAYAGSASATADDVTAASGSEEENSHDDTLTRSDVATPLA